jgi:spermidine/putrescine transport system permease protein
LGLQSIALAHVTFAVSYVLVAVRASLRGFDPALIDAARDLGADAWDVHRRVILPLITPGILAGALMAFTLSFDDFLISFFTAGVASDTLPMRLYSLIRFGMSREMYALSALMILVSGACAWLVSSRAVKAALHSA